jgi:DNA-binding FadR family transcriptional regulator
MRKNGDSRKLGEILAERIEDEIVAQNWPVGSLLGSEAELIERYGVSRAVFREAMRIVDHHGVAEMRRGPGGGLVITEPNLGAVVRAVSLQLQYERIRPEDVAESRKVLELSCVRLATERLNAPAAARIEEFLEREQERIKETRKSRRARGDLPSHDFHLLLADLTGNPALRVFVQMITRVLGEQSPRARSLERVAEEVHTVHARIAEALIAGDAEAAVRRMARHLDSVTGYLTAPAANKRRPAGRGSVRKPA